MELKSLYCPNCGAAVKPVDGLDTFYCPYCGYQIHLEGMSDEAYKARTKVKQMEHEERMQDKKDAYQKFVFEKKHEQAAKEEKESNQLTIFGGVLALALFVLAAVIGIFFS